MLPSLVSVAAEQIISSGGKGVINVMSGSYQYCFSEAEGIVDVMSGGSQASYGGSLIISTMYGGSQSIQDNGEGLVILMNGGEQRIRFSGCSGTVNVMEDGLQTIRGGYGTIDVMNSGVQSVEAKSAVGVISMLNGGKQVVAGNCSGSVNLMNGGSQFVSFDGSGLISTMSGGAQIVYGSNADGIVNFMSNGEQHVSYRATGAINTMQNGSQVIAYDAVGKINTMSGGTQIVYGTALDTIVYGGTQYVFGGTALNTTLNGGTQHVTNKCALTNTTVNNGVVVVTYDKTVVSDLTMTGGEYRLGTDGGSYNIGGKFAFTGGVFDMTKDINGNKARTYETLKIADLQRGGGTFILNTDLASEMNGDKIEITSAEAGSTYYVQVNDVSLTDNAQVSGAKKLLLITDASENANFVGNSIDKGGIWEILPDIKMEQD